MATQLVKKKFGGKRKGYKGKKQHWDQSQLLRSFCTWVKVGDRTIMDLATLAILNSLPGVFKDGGRVLKGVGKAKRMDLAEQ